MGLPVLRARLLGPMDLRLGERQLPPLDSGRAESRLAWLDPADAQRMIAATRAFAAAMEPFGTGASYLNFTHEADRVRDAYGDAKYARLVALKDTYDPANLFRLNQNIRPSSPAD
jgi:FAD/FMN-containing dehydrogenase